MNEATMAPTAGRQNSGLFTIATFNFLAGGSATRTGHWSAIRSRIKPDIMFVQESKAIDRRRFPYKAGLWQRVADRRWGSGLYTRSLVVDPVDVFGYEGWVVGGECVIGERRVRAFSVHAPAGDHGYVRTVHAMLDRILKATDNCDLVLGGDFNVAVGLRGDDEMVRMSKAERELMNRFGAELGLIPCWQAANPGVPLAQTLRWTGNRTAPYHCDGIFVPASWAAELVSCEVLDGVKWRRLSDHYPVVARFDLGQKRNHGE